MFGQENFALNTLAFWYLMQAMKDIKKKKEKR
jgi:hypothetical protein